MVGNASSGLNLVKIIFQFQGGDRVLRDAKCISCSTQLSIKLKLIIKGKMVKK